MAIPCNFQPTPDELQLKRTGLERISRMNTSESDQRWRCRKDEQTDVAIRVMTYF